MYIQCSKWFHLYIHFYIYPACFRWCQRHTTAEETWSNGLWHGSSFEIIISCLLGILKLNVKTSDAERPYTAALVRSGCNEGSSTFLLIPCSCLHHLWVMTCPVCFFCLSPQTVHRLCAPVKVYSFSMHATVLAPHVSLCSTLEIHCISIPLIYYGVNKQHVT